MPEKQPERKYIEVPFEIKAEDISEDGTFEGNASLFDNEPDAHRDLVARGAFTETISNGGRNKTGIAMLFQHQPDKIPGVWMSIQEDTRGLRVKGQLAIDTELGGYIHKIMKLGTKMGTWRFSLSIGFDTLDSEMTTVKVGDSEVHVRLIKKAELWEISIVTFPAKLGATVTNVKQIRDAKTIRDIEDALRDSGYSKADAQQFIAICKDALRESERKEKEDKKEEEDKTLSEILESLKMFNEEIQTKEDDLEMSGILEGLQEINLN